MPSGGAARATDRCSRTSSTSRSTSVFACSTGMSTARTWRCASARTCHICQVDRVSSMAASTRSAVCATQRASTIVAVLAGGVRAVRTIDATALPPPNTAAASLSQVAPLLSQGSGFVLGVAGLQGRLLSQLQDFDRCRWPAMILLELDGKLATAEVDLGPPGRPPLVQPRVDTNNFPDRPLARIGTRTCREQHPQRVAEVLL